jgi:hypothetical protein
MFAHCTRSIVDGSSSSRSLLSQESLQVFLSLEQECQACGKGVCVWVSKR